MAYETSGAGTAAGGTTLVIPGEMAARVDRLPMSAMAWEICLIVQIGWAIAVSTDAIAARMYPFVWLPAKEITHSQYDVLYALEVGIGILIGGYAMGWLSDKIGRRPSLIMSSVLAAVFIWPFAYVTNYPALALLSIGSTLGIGGYLAINVVYMSEIMGPTVRPRIMMVSQVVCIFLLLVVLGGIIPHYWFPSQYKLYLWLLAGLNVLVAIYLVFRMPESPRWLEARERRERPAGSWSGWRSGSARAAASPCPSPTCIRMRWWPRRRPAGWRRSASSTWSPPSSCWWSWCSATPASCTAATARSSCSWSSDRGYSAGTVFAITAWAGVVASAVYLLNAFFGERFERRWTQLFGAILFAGGYWGMYSSHSHRGRDHLVHPGDVGGILWLWSMYVYIPNNYPTRMRSLGTGWTDGIGHLGAWGGVLIAGQLFTVTAPRGFFVFITIPCAILPALLIAIFGKHQRRRALEELAR